MKMSKQVILTIILIAILAGAIIIQISGIIISRQELFSNCQPANIIYAGKSNYCVKIMSYNKLFSSMTKLFVISPNVDRGLAIEFTPVNIGSLTVDWQESAVNIKDGFVELTIQSSVFAK